jgi:hypothetical protein
MGLKFYVTTTDKFMSGWGKAEGKINKLVFICDNYEEALIVYNNAKARSDQKNINIGQSRPRYSQSKYYTQFKTKSMYPSWYIKDYFKKGA